MNERLIDVLETCARNSSPGPWEWCLASSYPGIVMARKNWPDYKILESLADFTFISAASPEAVLALTGECKRLKAENERLENALGKLRQTEPIPDENNPYMHAQEEEK